MILRTTSLFPRGNDIDPDATGQSQQRLLHEWNLVSRHLPFGNIDVFAQVSEGDHSRYSKLEGGAQGAS